MPMPLRLLLTLINLSCGFLNVAVAAMNLSAGLFGLAAVNVVMALFSFSVTVWIATRRAA